MGMCGCVGGCVGGCREEGRKEMDVLAPKKKRGRDVFFGGVVPPRNINGFPETLTSAIFK